MKKQKFEISREHKEMNERKELIWAKIFALIMFVLFIVAGLMRVTDYFREPLNWVLFIFVFLFVLFLGIFVFLCKYFVWSKKNLKTKSDKTKYIALQLGRILSLIGAVYFLIKSILIYS